jgi:glycosyltransferase involved in cell wall biosynthesis
MWEKFYHYRSLKILRNIIDTHEINLVHLNDNINRDFCFVYLFMKVGLEIISHLRSFDSDKFIAKKALYANKNVSMFIAISRTVRDHWIGCKLDQKKIVVLKNAISENNGGNKFVSKNHWRRNGKLKLGCLGIYHPDKGYRFMINAMPKIVKELPDVSLVIAGPQENRYKRDLRALIRDLKMEKYITLEGQVENGISFIGELDIFIVPFKRESFSRVLLEAWKVGVPVIMTNEGQINDIATNGKNCLMVTYGNVDEMVIAVKTILNEKELRHRLVENACATIKNEYSMAKYIDRLQNIYGEVCKGYMDLQKDI